MERPAQTAPPDIAGEPGIPLQGPGLLTRVAPFAVVAVLAEVSLVLESGPLSVLATTISAVLLVAAAAAFLLPWPRLPAWTQVIVPLLYAGSVLALTLAAGVNSGVGMVILVPLIWTVLFHQRWESACLVVAVTAGEAVVSVLQDASGAVISRRVVLWALLCALISVAAHGLRDRIQRSQARSAQLQERIRELTVLADRDRIAQDLNERVIRRILEAGTALQGVTLLTGEREVRRRLEATVNELDDAARMLRQTIFELGAHDSDPPAQRSL